MITKARLAALICLLSVAGCTHINTVRQIGPRNIAARAVFIDATQRAVTYVPSPAYDYDPAGRVHLVPDRQVVRVCAEPSPDAISAVATSAGLQLSVLDKLKLAGSASQSQDVESIGLRTQSIQLMRDLLYRICEDYQSGSLTPHALETLQRRYQSSAVAILAIEQLTGVVQAAQGHASAGGTVTTTVPATPAAAGSSGAGAATTGSATDTAGTASDASATAGKDAPATITATTTATPGPQAGGGSHADVQVVGVEAVNAVKSIVDDTLQLGFLREACATLFVAQIDGLTVVSAGQEGLGRTCADYARATVNSVNVDTDARKVLVDNAKLILASGRPLTPEEQAQVAGGLATPAHDQLMIARHRLEHPLPTTPDVSAVIRTRRKRATK